MLPFRLCFGIQIVLLASLVMPLAHAHAQREQMSIGDQPGLIPDAADEKWQTAAKLLRDRLPPIWFFPTFLFEFPQRIYLEEAGAHFSAAINSERSAGGGLWSKRSFPEIGCAKPSVRA